MKELKLIDRVELFPDWLFFVLLLSVVIVTVVKFIRPSVFLNLSATLIKPPSTIPYSRTNLSFLGGTNWLFIFNYFIISGLTVFMIMLYHGEVNYWWIILPVCYYTYQVLGLLFIGVISGELKKLTDNVLLLNFTHHIIGLLFLPILFIWILNSHLSSYIYTIILIIFILFWSLRIIRGILFAFKAKILWYYIILYLCGLEIWPLVAIYMFLPADSIR